MLRRVPPDEAWISPPPARGGGIRVAVAYPHSYLVGMSNLGYHTALRAFLEGGGFDVRRAFWEKGVLSLPDGGRTLRDFDVVAFSVSYQPDFIRLARMLAAGGLASPADGSPRPLLLGGGAALTINPEPAAPLLDLVVLGDGEPALPGLLRLFQGRGGREQVLAEAASLPGVYVPSLYGAGEDGPYLLPRSKTGAPGRIPRAVFPDLGRSPARPAVVARATEFGSMYLLEVSRGCGGNCRFCAAGVLCRPVRHLPLEVFLREMKRGLSYRGTLGLVGTAVSCHPRLPDMARAIHAAGGRFSPSSIRTDRLTPALADLLAESGHRTVTLAPEAGREGLRASLGKGFPDGLVAEAAGLLQERGIPHLKLYFMAGLPGESDEDAEGIVDLAASVRRRMVAEGRKRGKVGQLTLSLSPFVPKPHTPFEREPMAEEEVLQRRMKVVRDGAGRLGGVKVQTGSPRAAFLDGLLSLGDRRLAARLADLPAEGMHARQITRVLPGMEGILFGRREGHLPWADLGTG